MAIEISCPTCKKKTAYDPQNPFRPFCSERCRLVDLGTWLDEGFSIPVQNPADLYEQEQ